MKNIFTQFLKRDRPIIKQEQNRRRNYKESRKQSLRVRSYPIRGYLETTNRCNLRCQMCGQSFFEGERTDLSDEIIKKIQPLFPYFIELSIFGYGEALVDHRIFQILELIPNHVTTRLVTNGVLLDEKASQELINHQLKQLYISIEATNEETYSFVRGGRYFNRVIGNVERLLKLKRERNSPYPEVAFAFTFMKRTLAEFLDFVELTARLGIKIITGDYLIVYRPELMNESLFFHQEYTNHIFAQAREKAKTLGIELRIPPSFAEADIEKDKRKLSIQSHSSSKSADNNPEWKLCYEPWEFIYFRSDGFVSPCCANDVKLGDLRNHSFAEVWNGKQYQEFRRTVNTTRPHPHCQTCINTGKRIITQREYHIKLLDKNGKIIKI
ncbi:MAG: radical SAM protein [bacterium]|nr:radical SAM protein [bacterium]